MSFRLFDVFTMIDISGSWLDPEKDRPVLASIAMVAPLLPELDAAHGALVRIGSADSTRQELIHSLAEKAGQLDERRDDKLRGIYNVLDAWINLVDDTTLADALTGLRDKLFSKGVTGMLRDCLAPAGYADKPEKKLTAEMKSLLSRITCAGTDLSKETNEWFTAGQALAEMERKRVRHPSGESPASSPASFSPAEINAARARWSKVTDALITLMDINTSIDNDIRTRILQPLHKAEKKLAHRRQAVAFALSEFEINPRISC